MISLTESLTIDELTAIIRRFVEERDWTKYQRPLPLAISAAIEIGELLEMFQWLREEDIQHYLQNPEYIDALSDEIADVMVYLLRLADVIGIDISTAIISKMKKNELKYPVDEVRGKAPHVPIHE